MPPIGGVWVHAKGWREEDVADAHGALEFGMGMWVAGGGWVPAGYSPVVLVARVVSQAMNWVTSVCTCCHAAG